MNKVKSYTLFSILVLICAFGFILFYVSYEAILFSRLVPADQLRNLGYEKNIVLKIYSEEKILLYKNWFMWGGVVRENIFSDTLVEATSALSRQAPDESIFEMVFSRIYKIDKEWLNNTIINDFVSKMVNPDNSSSENESKFVKYIAAKNLLSRNKVKTLYLNYFNSYKFSKIIFGANGAAEYYFGKKFKSLSLREQLYIMSVAINKDNVDVQMSVARKREIDNILWSLYESNYINYDILNKNLSASVVFNKMEKVYIEPQLVGAVLAEMRRREVDYKKHSYTVYSTFDISLQRKIRSIIRKETNKKHKSLQAAFVLIDYKKAIVKAIVGGKKRSDKKNRALNIKRQVGSVFKPLVYLTAFNNGFKPSDRIIDKPYTFRRKGIVYRPKNFEDYFMGKTKIQNGLIYSLNNATVFLATKVGLSKITKLAVQMGFAGTRPFMAMPLGSIPFTPFEVASGYTIFGNNGIKKDISVIHKIIDLENGRNIIKFSKDQRIVSARATKQVVRLMRKVVSSGTARGAHLLKGTAGKTGTTNDYKDAWFVSIFSPYIGVCWVGFDDYRSMGKKGTGGQTAAPMVAKVQKSLIKDKK